MRFKFVSGRLCLDFAGTFRYREGVGAEETLSAPERLSDWAVQGRLVDERAEISDAELAAAIDLREAIYRTVVARMRGASPTAADVDLINAHASQPRLTPTLHADGSLTRGGDAARLLAALAADLLEMLAGPDADKVKRCSREGCTRLYIDASRGQNRHWCGMATCGNRAKVAAFRARQRASAGH
jgi:predicted RNA-binding Zn ribbon-like protein